MIASVQSIPSSFTNSLSRAQSQGVRNAAQQSVSAATGDPLRVIDQIDDGENVDVELSEHSAQNAGADQPGGFGAAYAEMEDPVQLAVGLLNQKTALRSNIAVLKTSDQMLGTLLDVVG